MSKKVITMCVEIEVECGDVLTEHDTEVIMQNVESALRDSQIVPDGFDGFADDFHISQLGTDEHWKAREFVISETKEAIEMGDVTAFDELLKFVPIKNIRAYLPQ